MTIEQLRKELRQFQTAARKLLRDEMPPIIGRLAVNHYRENFRKGGFVDSALEPWPVTRRQQSGGKFAAQRYGPLLSSRSHLMKSTRYETSAFRTRVFNDVDYASIHNSGGDASDRYAENAALCVVPVFRGRGRQDESARPDRGERNGGNVEKTCADEENEADGAHSQTAVHRAECRTYPSDTPQRRRETS